MKWVALVTWIATALAGGMLVKGWLAGGGIAKAKEPGRRIRPWMILAHAVLAAAGLIIWIIYVAIDDQGLNWLAFLVLLPVVVLGWWMFAIWFLRRGREQPSPATTPTASGTPGAQIFPVRLVAVHGVLAVVTLILVLIESAAGES